MSEAATRRGEFQTIQALFAPLAASAPGALGLSDDAAVIAPPHGMEAVVTVDAICEGIHYLPSDPPNLVAQKLMRVNLSDLAAMGATPGGVFLTCAYPQQCTDEWVERFSAGLALDVAQFQAPVLGGDTVSTRGPALFSLTALGWVPAGQALRRNGAQPGDLIAVTGTLGDGALGLWAARLLAEDIGSSSVSGVDRPDQWVLEALAERYQRPQPRLRAGQALRGLASAALDVSDGLVQDLGHICKASGVCAEIQASALPLSLAFRAAMQYHDRPIHLALGGGDDYELCVTIPEPLWSKAVDAVGDCGLTVIGRCLSAGEQQGQGIQQSVVVYDDVGSRVDVSNLGWQHF